MARLGERIQTGDWKQEKHVPAIECPSEVKPDELFEVKVGLGKVVAHPNTTEHHIRWINAFFHPPKNSPTRSGISFPHSSMPSSHASQIRPFRSTAREALASYFFVAATGISSVNTPSI